MVSEQLKRDDQSSMIERCEVGALSLIRFST